MKLKSAPCGTGQLHATRAVPQVTESQLPLDKNTMSPRSGLDVGEEEHFALLRIEA